jgi:hypothetical protein
MNRGRRRDRTSAASQRVYRHGKHLDKREDPSADIVVAVDVVVQGAVEPGPPDYEEQGEVAADAGEIDMLGERMGELSDEYDVHQIIEQLEKSYAAFGGAIRGSSGNLPPTPKSPWLWIHDLLPLQYRWPGSCSEPVV